MQTPQTEEHCPERFADYIAARRFDPPRSLLIRAADLAEPKDHALDAGAGALNATRYLLSAGFKHVTAFDSALESQTFAAELPREKVRFVLSRFEDFDYPDRIELNRATPPSQPVMYSYSGRRCNFSPALTASMSEAWYAARVCSIQPLQGRQGRVRWRGDLFAGKFVDKYDKSP